MYLTGMNGALFELFKEIRDHEDASEALKEIATRGLDLIATTAI